jgi:hypothetical protein
MASQFQLSRLRVMWRGVSVYDQKFHGGLNIIRGQNSSGKSTISDFIFYAFGGEIERWKGAARTCDEVQAEIKTKDGTITVRREIDDKPRPPFIFYGPMSKASESGLDDWFGHPLRRTDTQISYSQVMFRASGIPEAPGGGDSNITLHQIMRLLYADQRTPAGRLFRFENWDTGDIREATGDLICGLSVYEAYEAKLRLRDLDKKFAEKQHELSLRIAAMPPQLAGVHLEALEAQIREADSRQKTAANDIANVGDLLPQDIDAVFFSRRKKIASLVTKLARKVRQLEDQIETEEFEIGDLDKYRSFLNDMLERLSNADGAATAIGSIDFTYCPSCLSPLEEKKDPTHCSVCGSPQDPDAIHSKYLHIKFDLQIQLRDSDQLKRTKLLHIEELKGDLRRTKDEYHTQLNELATKFDSSSSPRETFLAERHQLIGQIDRELLYLRAMIEVAADISKLISERDELATEIERTKDRLSALSRAGDARKRRASTLISKSGCEILKSDLPRQEEFQTAQSLELSFRDDAITLDGNMNFSESSNTVLKNSAILALFVAATLDREFNHPRFLLMDNVEDKGMEEIRSHNFQMIVEGISKSAKTDHQIIFTTSMMNPALEKSEYVIGPFYTRENKTLKFPANKPTGPIGEG